MGSSGIDLNVRIRSDTGKMLLRDGAGMTLDLSYADLAEVLESLTAMQDVVSELLRLLVQCPLEEIESGIETALARLGIFCGVDRSYVFQIRADGQVMDNTHEWCAEGISAEIANLQGLPVDTVAFWLPRLTAGYAVQVADVASLPDERAAERAVLTAQGIRSLLVVPMVSAGSLVGFVGFDSVRRHRRFTAGELNLLRPLADAITGALVRHQASRDIANAQARLAAITRHSSDLILITDDAGSTTWASPSARVALGGCLAEQGWLACVEPVDRPTLASLFSDVSDRRGQGDSVRLPDHRVCGRDDVRWMDGWLADLRDDPAVAGFVITLHDVTERRRAADQLHYQAHHDLLTGLPNRISLNHYLETVAVTAAFSGRRVGVLFIDLDHFKMVNDLHGHSIGDALLQALAARLRLVLGEADICARFGGDEFVIVIVEAGDGERILATARRLLADLSAAIKVGSREIYVGTSIGIAIQSGPGAVAEEMLKQADAAMYAAKRAGRGRFAVFDDAMRVDVARRTKIAQHLHAALQNGYIRPAYQPVVSLHTGEILGFEALSRWDDPSLGPVPPGDFIPVAEEIGLVRRLDIHVLAQAIREFGRSASTWGLQVNLSPYGLEDAGLAETLLEILERAAFPPSKLTVEITESAFVTHSARISTLKALQQLGVRLAIDDFGTGYSSLSLLHALPVDVVKIDKSFVAQMTDVREDRRLVQAIIGLADDFGLEVVAEGIETERQATLLRELGCLKGQGYRYGRPGPLPRGMFECGSGGGAVSLAATPAWMR